MKGGENIKLALLTVSYSGLWYDGDHLSLKDQVLKAKELGFEGLSIEAKRPVASPLDLDKKEREEIKKFIETEGIEICAVEGTSNFASPVMEERENNLAMMKQVLKLANDLEVDLVKIFAAWGGVKWDPGEVADYVPISWGGGINSKEDLKRWQRARKGIKEVAKWAEDYGIEVALQNHAPVIGGGYEDALSMVNEIDMENVKLCLDVPLFHERQDNEYIEQAVQKCGDLIAHSHYGAWNFEENEDEEVVQKPLASIGKPINYEAFIRELKKIDYEGYLAQELCAPVIRNHEHKGLEETDRKNKLAVRYMKKLIDEV